MSAKYYTGKGLWRRKVFQLDETDLFDRDVGKEIYICK